MSTQSHRFRVFSAEALQDLSPKHTSRTHLRHFHEVVFAHVPEEGQTFCESVNFQAGFFTGTDVFHTVSQRVAQFQVTGCAAFLNVVTGNGNGVEFRHVVRSVFENVTDDTHGHIRRINIGITYHEFFQNIVLNSTGHDLLVDTLFLTGYDEERQDRQNGPVHGHGYGHLIQRNAGEQDIHIQHGANRNACFTNVTDYAGVIRIIAAVGRQVKRDGQTFLTGCQVAAVESVGFFCGGETGILTYRPGTEHVHGRIRSAQERRNTAHEVQMVAGCVYILGI